MTAVADYRGNARAMGQPYWEEGMPWNQVNNSSYREPSACSSIPSDHGASSLPMHGRSQQPPPSKNHIVWGGLEDGRGGWQRSKSVGGKPGMHDKSGTSESWSGQSWSNSSSSSEQQGADAKARRQWQAQLESYGIDPNTVSFENMSSSEPSGTPHCSGSGGIGIDDERTFYFQPGYSRRNRHSERAEIHALRMKHKSEQQRLQSQQQHQHQQHQQHQQHPLSQPNDFTWGLGKADTAGHQQQDDRLALSQEVHNRWPQSHDERRPFAVGDDGQGVDLRQLHNLDAQHQPLHQEPWDERSAATDMGPQGSNPLPHSIVTKAHTLNHSNTALEELRMLKAFGQVNVDAYNRAMAACIAGGTPGVAKRLFQEMVAAGLEDDESFRLMLMVRGLPLAAQAPGSQVQSIEKIEADVGWGMTPSPSPQPRPDRCRHMEPRTAFSTDGLPLQLPHQAIALQPQLVPSTGFAGYRGNAETSTQDAGFQDQYGHEGRNWANENPTRMEGMGGHDRAGKEAGIWSNEHSCPPHPSSSSGGKRENTRAARQQVRAPPAPPGKLDAPTRPPGNLTTGSDEEPEDAKEKGRSIEVLLKDMLREASDGESDSEAEVDEQERQQQLLAQQGGMTYAFEGADYEEHMRRVPRDEKGEPTSIGSIKHDVGECKACIFVNSKLGCKNGVFCAFCHFKHHKRNRKKNKLRPCKGKRDRYRKLLGRLTKQIMEDPGSFDVQALQLPPSITVNEAAKEKLMLKLKTFRQEVLIERQTDGQAEHSKRANAITQLAL